MRPTDKTLKKTTDTKNVTICDLCNETDFNKVFVVENVQLIQCENCGLVLSNPRVDELTTSHIYESEYYEKANNYSKTQEDINPEDVRLGECLNRKLKSQNKDTKLVAIDIGCGAGHRVGAFSKVGFTALGLEPSKSSCINGRNRGRDIRKGFLGEVDLPSAHLITAFHVLEHVPSPSRFLAECYKQLDVGGHLLIEVPDFACQSSRKMGKNWPYLYPSLHHYQFSESTLKQYVKKAGFEILKINRVGGRGFLTSDSGIKTIHPESPISEALTVSDWKSKLFAQRRYLYKIPGVQKISRLVMWELLRQNLFIRVLVQK